MTYDNRMVINAAEPQEDSFVGIVPFCRNPNVPVVPDPANMIMSFSILT